MENIVLSAAQLIRDYRIGGRVERVVDNVSLSVERGEFVVISGKSGSGKTTLLSLLSGLEQPTQGQVILGGHDITRMGEDELGHIRNRLTGFVFQSFHLIPSLTALENVMFPAELNRDPASGTKAEQLLRKVDLWARRESFPEQLSGGERQRVALCRALVNEPEIIFADEPTGNLDSENSNRVIELLVELHRERQTSLVMATHSAELAARADRVVLLRDGKIVEDSGEQR